MIFHHSDGRGAARQQTGWELRSQPLDKVWDGREEEKGERRWWRWRVEAGAS